ncbi:M15 family metallopeptidase [Paenibacillus thermotolerans]|uniref:M15 family metallopeptidase n=1 Tax=Paenibacillus thermotolerans TaxID=3027807 RepID=UPI00236862C5|nr:MULTISPECIES: D-alanyl-D-alanine carboxypeptidase family protein [unclassified Paenibacillus]
MKNNTRAFPLLLLILIFTVLLSLYMPRSVVSGLGIFAPQQASEEEKTEEVPQTEQQAPIDNEKHPDIGNPPEQKAEDEQFPIKDDRKAEPDKHPSKQPEKAKEDGKDKEQKKPDVVPAMVGGMFSDILLVNKRFSLPSDYTPQELVVPDVPFSFDGYSPKKQLEKEAAHALEILFAAAKDEGLKLNAVSGYRSYGTQKAIFDRNAKRKGAKEANRTSAYPGQSEHQTGLAMDVSTDSIGNALEESFGETEEGMWLADNAMKYGFIIRYPKSKEEITGYKYEPWHLRYVGVEAATYLSEHELTLEEYHDQHKQ